MIPNNVGHFDEFPPECEPDPEFDNDPCREPYAYNGVCPCCGGYVRTIGGNYDNDPMWDECDTCSWKGDVEYD